MCHLCRKIEKLGGINPEATKPLFTILSKLHKSAEPRMGNMWLWRLQQTEKLQALLGKLCRLMPIPAVQAILDEVDKDIIHIEKSLVDHAPLKRTRRRSPLKSKVGPSESASICPQKEKEIQDKHVGKAKSCSNNPVKQRIRRPSAKGAVLNRGATPYSRGSDIDPSSPRIRQSIRIVDEWFDRCHNSIRLSTQTESDKESVVFDAIGDVRERPRVTGSGIWKNLTTHPSENLENAAQRLQDEISGGGSLVPSIQDSLGYAASARNATSRKKRNAWHPGVLSRNDTQKDQVFSLQKETTTMSSRPSALNAGSMMRIPHSSSNKNSPKQNTTEVVFSETKLERFSSPSVPSPQMPVGIGRESSPLRDPRVEWAELSMLQTATQEESRRGGARSKTSKSTSHEKGRDQTCRTPTQKEHKGGSEGSKVEADGPSNDSELPYAIRSRRRRRECGVTTVPFNDRYRHDERQRHWQTRKP